MTEIQKIGIFDSGVGGLTVLKSLVQEIGFERIIYYGDTARLPYGNKDKETIVRFSLEALEFFAHFDIDMLVVACNTASAHAIKAMRECSSIPIIGVIESGVQALCNRSISFDSQVLVLATEATIKSQSYDNTLRKIGYNNIINIPTNLFVSLVEENIFSGEILEATFRHYFGTLIESRVLKPEAVILGCTHFPLLLDSLRSFFGGETTFIHSGDAIASFLRENYLGLDCVLKGAGNLDSKKPNHIEFFASDNVNKLKNTAKIWLKDVKYTMKG